MSVSGVSSNPGVPAYTPPTQQPAIASPATTAKDTVSISDKAQQLATDGDAQMKKTQEAANLSYPITGYGFSTGGLS